MKSPDRLYRQCYPENLQPNHLIVVPLQSSQRDSEYSIHRSYPGLKFAVQAKPASRERGLGFIFMVS